MQDGACSCGLRGCGSPGKHPLTAHGVKDATTAKGQIIEWWAAWPYANVALATGKRSFVALDIDFDHGGSDTLRFLEKRFGELPPTVTSLTGGGGTHYLFRPPEETVANAVNVGGAKGIDVRGEGGYIIAPPSLHCSGQRYTWDAGALDPTQWNLAEMPDWLRELIHLPQFGEPREHCDTELRLVPGERNDKLFRHACRLRDAGFGPYTIGAFLAEANDEHCSPPLTEREIKLLLGSVLRYERTVPKDRAPRALAGI